MAWCQPSPLPTRQVCDSQLVVLSCSLSVSSLPSIPPAFISFYDGLRRHNCSDAIITDYVSSDGVSHRFVSILKFSDAAFSLCSFLLCSFLLCSLLTLRKLHVWSCRRHQLCMHNHGQPLWRVRVPPELGILPIERRAH